MNKLFGKAIARINVLELTTIGVGVLAFFVLLLIPAPPYISGEFHQPDWSIFIVSLIFFTLLFRKNGKGWERIIAVMVFALFAMSLIYKWKFAYYDGMILGGLIPWSDASGYYTNAYRLYVGLDLSVWATRRPLFTVFLSVLLRLVNGNFMYALACLTLLNAMAVYLTTSILKKLYGAFAAAAFLLVSYVFYERFSGEVVTEQLGFMLGNLALSFLLVGVYNKKVWHALLGLGLLTLGLNARAGAFFILPVLVVWLAYCFHQSKGFWNVFIFGIAVIIISFTVNLMLVKVFGNSQGRAFSNYSYTLYGLASGNKGWWQALKDYPDLNEREIMPLVLRKIRENPGLLLYGMQESYKDYFRTQGAFSFIFLGKTKSTAANGLLWGIVLIALIKSYFDMKSGVGGLIIASFVGVLASLCLLPPIDADGMRVFAATIPFTALWVAVGSSALFRFKSNLIVSEISGPSDGFDFPFPTIAFGLSFFVFTLVGPAPLVLRAFPVELTSYSQPMCKSDQKILHIFMPVSTSVVLIPDEAAQESYMPFIRLSDFRRPIKMGGSLYPFLDEELLGIKPDVQISRVLNLDNPTEAEYGLWVVSGSSAHESELYESEFKLCGRITQNRQLQSYGFYYAVEETTSPVSLAFSQQYPTITSIFRLFFGVVVGVVMFVLLAYGSNFKRLASIFLIIQAMLMAQYVLGKLSFPFSQQRFTLHTKHSKPEEGYLYILPLKVDWMSQSDLGQSPAIVYENGVPLPFPNSIHQTIRERGEGRYSLWEGALYFSASDNTDPRVNGRKYEMRWSYPIQPIWQWLSYLAGISGVVVVFFDEHLKLR